MALQFCICLWYLKGDGSLGDCAFGWLGSVVWECISICGG